jgi:hypothetical protein
MPSPNLDRLCGAGVLHAEPPAADEFAGLLRSGLARLQPRCRLRSGGSKDQGLAAAQLMNTSPIPAAYAWPALLAKDGDTLFDHYRHMLEALGRQPGTLALIFGKAQNKFREAKLRRVIVDLIDAEDWSAMGADVKGDAYEGLLERNASLACTDIKSGAGQYSTPRALIQAKVDCIAPRPGAFFGSITKESLSLSRGQPRPA